MTNVKTPLEVLEGALDTLGLPKLISKEDVKLQYRFLAKKYHPDVGGSSDKMEQINHAYKIVMHYIDSFRYSFDDDEIQKQFPGVDYVKKFRP
ncbi:MAG: Heat shock protein [uncultured Sulfurovum sp.]|uniref:Heat shock protein n=1 Tax=uncultured Sulfurovum sp. TaxID=269237 RepID=A0A6S6TB55_9BACT|nr:MAG: Heat shock protein [uncultured Sulfurovum sp.]